MGKSLRYSTPPLQGRGRGWGQRGPARCRSGLLRPATTPDPSSKEEGLKGRVYINKSQYFEHVPELAWNFHIGGYQPAQKWLKDRKGRKLSWDDIRHYQKIIKILNETGRIMGEIKLPLDG